MKIEINDLKEGYLYRLNARNIRIGIWNPSTHGGKGSFIGIRTKFSSRFLDTELHYDSDLHFGTATPIEELGICPLNNIKGDIGTVCGKCHYDFSVDVPVEYLPYKDGPRTKTYCIGKDNEHTVTYNSGWQHLDNTGKCNDPYGLRLSNDELFSYLERMEKEFPDAERR